MGDVPEQVYRDAAEAFERNRVPGHSGDGAYAQVMVGRTGFRSAVESAYRAGRMAAAKEISTAENDDPYVCAPLWKAMCIADEAGTP